MTVRHLWKVLEEAGCGVAVGLRDFLSESRQILAVDLSIWICEALSSTAMCTFHLNPAVHLVVQRTVALLKIGVKLVAIIEGKGCKESPDMSYKMTKYSSDKTDFIEHKNFWSSCNLCVEVLTLLGVPVLHANKNGEALCSLLNERGLVDGVISNDGDCFLYGAKTVYTNFSIDSLNQGKIIRYDSSSLSAVSSLHENPMEANKNNISDEKLSLSRKDLIAFAILTGSDECSGVPYVGFRKAIKFIHSMKKINPNSQSDATLNEIERWSETVHESQDAVYTTDMANDKTMNKGVCFSSFLNSMRAKMITCEAYSVVQKSIREYLSPNSNFIPDGLNNLQKFPNFDELMVSPIIMKGKNIQASREYLQNLVLGLLARLLVLKRNDIDCQRNLYYRSFTSNAEVVTPNRILRTCHHKGNSCYEISWHRGVFEFTTIEWQDAFLRAYPGLVALFNESERWGKQLEMRNYRLQIFLGREYVPAKKTIKEQKRKFETAIHVPRPRYQKRKRDFKEKISLERVQLRSKIADVDTSEDTAFLSSSTFPFIITNNAHQSTDHYDCPNSECFTPRTTKRDRVNIEEQAHANIELGDNDLVTPAAKVRVPDYSVVSTMQNGDLSIL